jgi:uncharacterized repeat protein (TIGR03803 family)
MNSSVFGRHIRSLTLALVCALLACGALVQAQTYTPIYSYGTHTGDPRNPTPFGWMSQGRDGNLYTTTAFGGATNNGAAFNITTSGSLTKLLDFVNDAAVGGLTLGFDGNFYGVGSGGGTSNVGTLFKLTPSGQRTTLWNFTSFDDGANPAIAPLQGQDGKFYGTNPDNRNGDFGLIYRSTSIPGKPKVLGEFVFTNGANPNLPVLGMDGNFYGTARAGGTGQFSCQNFCGVVYKMTPAGKITVLHNFSGFPNDGSQPVGVLAQANDGTLYGTTFAGGADNRGTIFKITPAGTYTLLHSFHDVAGSDGINPWTGVVVGTDGDLYGTAQGGKHSSGVLFKITPTGTETVLYNFCSLSGCADGFFPQTPIMQHTDGKFYGSVESGGKNGLNGGVFYSLDMSLQPFVALLNWQGTKGKTIEILGQGFTGTSNVSFNQTTAAFTVVSDTYLTATVPAAATTGLVTVKTPNATLISNRKFFVIPTITSVAPTSGAVSTAVTITGNNLTGATKVLFGGGKAATFSVTSDTQIMTSVPTGAVTGKIKVTTAGGTATSAATFTVTP